MGRVGGPAPIDGRGRALWCLPGSGGDGILGDDLAFDGVLGEVADDLPPP
ncbi:hypothetical protein [Microlunatus sp. GCM10028923]